MTTYLVKIEYQNGTIDWMKFIRSSILEVLEEVLYESKWNLFYSQMSSIKITVE